MHKIWPCLATVAAIPDWLVWRVNPSRRVFLERTLSLSLRSIFSCSSVSMSACKASIVSSYSLLRQILGHLTGCKVQKVHTSLGTSCHNAYTRFQWLLAHAYIPFNYNWIQLRHCGRKYLNWCASFGPYSQCSCLFYYNLCFNAGNLCHFMHAQR